MSFFFFFGFSSCLAVLPYSDVFVFDLFYFYTLDACLFSYKRQKGCGSDGEPER